MPMYKLICDLEERDDTYNHLGTAKKAAKELSLMVDSVVDVFDIENYETKATYKNGELFKVFEQEYESDSSLFTGEDYPFETNVEYFESEQEERNVDSTLKCVYMIQCTNTLTGKKSFPKSIGAEKVPIEFNSEEEAKTFLADVKSEFPYFLRMDIICLTN